MERETASAYYQLKIGHGYFKSYLHRFNQIETDRCPCSGTAKQTPQHLILECKKYTAERQGIFKALETKHPSLDLVFNSNRGRTALLEYLQKTRIATRRWYQGLSFAEN